MDLIASYTSRHRCRLLFSEKEGCSMAHDPVLVENTCAWLTKVAHDLRGAEIDLAAAPPLLGDLAFHCQQAIEKAFKAYLTWHDTPFRKTHDLHEVADQCAGIDPTLLPFVNRVTPLT